MTPSMAKKRGTAWDGVKNVYHIHQALFLAALSRMRVEVQRGETHRIDRRSVDLGGGVLNYLGEVLERLDSHSRSPTPRLPFFDPEGVEHHVLVDGDGAHAALTPKVFEARRAQLRVSGGVRDRNVPEPILDRAGVNTVIGELVAATVPEHVKVHR
jgi:hypothetical protein